jgi:Ca2+/Na+ antiporter
MKVPSPRAKAALLLVASILLSLAGIGGFIVLFARDFTVYWLILSPVIITLYQLPAVYVFWLYRRRRQKGRAKDDTP